MNPLYELVPISEKPTHTDFYFGFTESSTGARVRSGEYRWERGQWNKWDVPTKMYHKAFLTHWLRPIDPETLKAMIREELGKAYDAGFDYDVKLMGGGNETPDRETYTNSVIDNFFKQ